MISEEIIYSTEILKKALGSLRLQEAAKAIGVSYATMTRLHRGGQPSFETFKKLEAWLRQHERNS